MTQALADMRRDYTRDGLNEAQAPSEPFTLFHQWFGDAVKTEQPPVEANAMTLATVDEDGKALPFGEAEAGATALELLLPLTLKWAQDARLPLATALARITCDPAAILGSPAGQLAAGAPADVCIFDPEALWQVADDTLVSQGKNTPFQGCGMQGRVTTTIVGGRVVFSA